MLFSSTTFIYLFLPSVLLVYFAILHHKRFLQNVFLFLASLFFYAWGEPKFVFVMIASIIVNWLLGLCIDIKRNNIIASKMVIGIDIAFNLGLLFVFKYLAFTEELLQTITGFDYMVPKIALPIGISFFTFQAMSYVIDVYHQKGEVQKNLLYVGLYISFFPQLIAGPIVRYETIADEIKNRKETIDDFFGGFERFIVGLSKKVLLANSFAILSDVVFDTVKAGEPISVLLGWLGAIAYTLQIYFDFSGYSDMAIGLGRIFGFHFLENFNYPYIATSITEFWRRWHMSLGTWFRDYLYIPLGGSRCGKARTILNIFIVWALTGIWHGANLTFVIWGLFYFVLLIIEKASGIVKEHGKTISIFKWVYTMFFVVLGWVIFRAESLSDASSFLKSLFGLSGNVFLDGAFWGWFSQNLILIILGIVFSTPFIKHLFKKSQDNWLLRSIKTAVICFLFVLSVASLVSNSYNPFIYFNF